MITRKIKYALLAEVFSDINIIDKILTLDGITDYEISLIVVCGNQKGNIGRFCFTFTKEKIVYREKEDLIPEIYKNKTITREELEQFDKLLNVEVAAVFNALNLAYRKPFEKHTFFPDIVDSCYNEVCVVEKYQDLLFSNMKETVKQTESKNHLIIQHCFDLIEIVKTLAAESDINPHTGKIINKDIILSLKEELKLPIKMCKYKE